MLDFVEIVGRKRGFKDFHKVVPGQKHLVQLLLATVFMRLLLEECSIPLFRKADNAFIGLFQFFVMEHELELLNSVDFTHNFPV